ncbi:transposase [Streptomyces sp. PvR018]
MPADFPPWDRVYAFFRRCRDHALVREFHDRLRGRVIQKAGRDVEPTAGVIDSQSVKADAVVGADSRGFDGGKLIDGRKRHVVVDTLGLLLGVMVTSADIGDRAAKELLAQVREREPTRRWLGQPAPRDQAFRLRPQPLHLGRHHVHAERDGHLLTGRRQVEPAAGEGDSNVGEACFGFVDGGGDRGARWCLSVGVAGWGEVVDDFDACPFLPLGLVGSRDGDVGGALGTDATFRTYFPVFDSLSNLSSVIVSAVPDDPLHEPHQ